MQCCQHIKPLGCSYSCDTIQIGVNAPATGEYTLELQPDSIRVVRQQNTAGSPLVFSGGYLNEDATSVFKIIKPDGTYYETTDGEDCFQIEIKPTTNAALADNNITPVGCDPATVHNSDDTYSVEVASGGDLELADITFNVNLDGVLQSTTIIPAAVDATININWT